MGSFTAFSVDLHVARVPPVDSLGGHMGFGRAEPIFHSAENKGCTSPSRWAPLRFHLQQINQMKPSQHREACFHLTSCHLSFIMDRTQDNKAFGLFSFF